MKKISVLLLISLGILAISPALIFAKNYTQDVSVSSSQTSATVTITTKDKIQELREQYREQLKQALKDKKEDIKNLIGEKKEALKTMSAQEREAFKKLIEQKREDAKAIMEQHREEFKNKLEGFKDERKKEIAQRVDDNLDKMNKNRTDHFSLVVDKLEKILANIELRVDKVQSASLDVTSVRANIIEAENAIASARTAIEKQAGNIYVVALTTENNLGQDLKTAREKLFNDLNVLREMIIKVRNAVHKSATTLAQIKGIDKVDNGATSTSTASTTLN